jgi:hypothetical protein
MRAHVCRMEAGIEHFSKVLKRAYELDRTGMSISVIFSASHAHIEGCAQLGRYGKAENTVLKLKELAEYASDNVVPYAIDTIADRLHLWWREKRASLYSRQVQHQAFSASASLHSFVFLCFVAPVHTSTSSKATWHNELTSRAKETTSHQSAYSGRATAVPS